VVTIFTTFTYFTTSYDEDNSAIVVSSEDTITNIILASTAQQGIVASEVPAIQASKPTKIEQTVFSLPVPTSGDVESSSSSVFTPTLQSSEGEDDRSTQDSLSTATSPISSSLSFEEVDDELTLTTEDEDATTEPTTQAPRRIVRPSRPRGRGSSSRPGNTFTPIIRPILRKPGRFLRPTNNKVSTTVATRTRISIKPTLIATPASSALNTPQFSSSRFLASASLLNRGQSRFSSSLSRFSGSPSSAVSPSSVTDRGSSTFSATIAPTQGSRAISPFRNRVRAENPFRARLRELAENRLRQKNAERNSAEAKKTEEPNNDSNTLPIPNFPSVPGANTPIFVSAQRQRVSKPPTPTTQEIEIPDDIALRRQRARERIRSLFSSRRESLRNSRRKRQISLSSDLQGDLISSRQKRQQHGDKLRQH